MTEHLLHTAAAGFESACRIDVLPAGHRARRLHGHSFLARVRAALPDGWAAFPGGEVAALRERLEAVLAPLDYRLLNEVIAVPTDENLARWIRACLTEPGREVPGLGQIGVQSTRDSGVDLDADGHAHVWRRYVFEAAHQLTGVPADHKCARMHGHGFEVILHADQDLGARDLGVDYDHLDACWAPLHAQLHHACLNDIPGLQNPTSERIAAWLWERLAPVLPELSWVTVYETASCGAHYDGRSFRIWKEFSLDSAVRLHHAPDGDQRRRIHGHTYTLRLHLHAPLDEVRGWTVDFGEVKALFDPVFRELDHQPLYALPGVADNDPASLARWIRARAQPLLPALDRIDLYETRGSGAILSWGAEGPALPV